MGNVCDGNADKASNEYEYMGDTKNSQVITAGIDLSKSDKNRKMLKSMKEIEDDNVVSSSSHFPSEDIAEMDTNMNEPHPENKNSFLRTEIWSIRDNKKATKNPSTGYRKCFRYLDTNLTYQGQYSNGLKEGLGTEISELGEVYTGNFHNDLRHGSGLLITIHGEIIKCYFLNDEAEGEGESFNPKTNIRYKGKFVDSRKEVQGVEEGPDGYKYEGQFHEGYKNGEGKLTLPNGDVYQGKFLNDKYHGPGVLVYGKESKVKKYDGELRGGKWHGIGTVEYKDGRIFEGECINGGINGYGVMFVPEVGVFEGEFSDGLKEGEVVFYSFSRKQRSRGKYDDDRLIADLNLLPGDEKLAQWPPKHD